MSPPIRLRTNSATLRTATYVTQKKAVSLWDPCEEPGQSPISSKALKTAAMPHAGQKQHGPTKLERLEMDYGRCSPHS